MSTRPRQEDLSICAQEIIDVPISYNRRKKTRPLYLPTAHFVMRRPRVVVGRVRKSLILFPAWLNALRSLVLVPTVLETYFYDIDGSEAKTEWAVSVSGVSV